MTDGDVLLRVRDLEVHFSTRDGVIRAVSGLDFDVRAGRTLAIVGESGSGKSTAVQAVMGLNRSSRAKVTGQALMNDVDLLTLSEKHLRRYRGNDVAMIFQDPLSALHPYYTVGWQLAEAYRMHHQTKRKQARRRAEEMLGLVGIPEPGRRLDQYPHEFSGGMRQRVMIAMALINDPRVILADEPTTALDVTVQAQILELLKDLQRDTGAGVVVVTHDLGVVADVADEVLVMYAGRAVEFATVRDVFYDAQMPYTWGLLESVPSHTARSTDRLTTIPGAPPSLLAVPTGCPFHPRCTHRAAATADCTRDLPDLVADSGSGAHLARCHIPVDVRRQIFESRMREPA